MEMAPTYACLLVPPNSGSFKSMKHTVYKQHALPCIGHKVRHAIKLLTFRAAGLDLAQHIYPPLAVQHPCYILQGTRWISHPPKESKRGHLGEQNAIHALRWRL